MADMEKTINLLETAMRYNSIGLGRIVVHHDTISDALELLKSQQAEIKRLQPKKGEWEPMEDYDDVVYRCSACEEEWTLIEGTPFDNGMKFCPHCGADMRDSYHFVSNS